jgi:hypothetical protein
MWQAQGPEFKPQYCQKKKDQDKIRKGFTASTPHFTSEKTEAQEVFSLSSLPTSMPQSGHQIDTLFLL